MSRRQQYQSTQRNQSRKTKRKPSTKRGLPLPPITGPKLAPFPFSQPETRIKWIKRLHNWQDEYEDSETDSSLSGSCSQGYVFEAEIEGRKYAIKVFKFYNPKEDKRVSQWQGIDTMPATKKGHYLDPFYAECRAYGRIKECQAKKPLKYNITTECYGYILLDKDNEQILREAMKVDLPIPNPAYQLQTYEQNRPRAIVKDLIERSTPFDETVSSLGRILLGIVELNTIGHIFNRDIQAENFRDGRLVDFGSAFTLPHEVIDAMSPNDKSETKLTDRGQFDTMVLDETWLTSKDRAKLPRLHQMRLRGDGPLWQISMLPGTTWF